MLTIDRMALVDAIRKARLRCSGVASCDISDNATAGLTALLAAGAAPDAFEALLENAQSAVQCCDTCPVVGPSLDLLSALENDMSVGDFLGLGDEETAAAAE